MGGRDASIRIEDLTLQTIIGVHEWERVQPQEVRIALTIELDLSAAAASDDLEDSLDYRALTKAVIAHVEGSHFKLLEALAASIADLVLDSYPRVDAVTVRVDKPGALRHARTVAVELHRSREP